MQGAWVDAPEMRLDLCSPLAERYEAVEPVFWSSGRRLAMTLRATLPLRPSHLPLIHSFPLVERFHPEASAIGERLDLPSDEVLVANLSYDLALSSILCSAAAVTGPDGPALARNLEWWPQREMARASSLLRFDRGEAPAFWIAGWPGSIGAISGMSAHGFALTLNAAFCDEPAPDDASPVMLLLRCVLEEARGYDEAMERLCAEPLAAPAIVMLVGARNDQRVVIERTPTRCALRRPDGDEPLVATNLFQRLPSRARVGGRGELLRTARRRHRALSALLRAGGAGQSDEALLEALSHPAVRMRITAQQMVFRPGPRRVRLVAPSNLLKRSSCPVDRAERAVQYRSTACTSP